MESGVFPTIVLTQAYPCYLDMLLNGGLSPLIGFMNEEVYNSVVDNTRLPNGVAWPIPYCLDVGEDFSDLEIGTQLALRDTEGFMPAVLTVESVWRIDKESEAKAIYGMTDTQHPGVTYSFDAEGSHYGGGSISAVQLTCH